MMFGSEEELMSSGVESMDCEMGELELKLPMLYVVVEVPAWAWSLVGRRYVHTS